MELETLIQEIELILNNRPIDVDYDDDQEDILSPSHLTFGRQLSTTKMSTQNSDSDLNLSKRKKMLQFLTIFGLDGGENMLHHYVSFRNQSKINQQRNNRKD